MSECYYFEYSYFCVFCEQKLHFKELMLFNFTVIKNIGSINYQESVVSQ